MPNRPSLLFLLCLLRHYFIARHEPQASAADGTSKRKWEQAVKNVSEEFTYIKNIKNELNSFHAPKPEPEPVSLITMCQFAG
jgi:hypothetical protein